MRDGEGTVLSIPSLFVKPFFDQFVLQVTPCSVDVVNYNFKPDLCIKIRKLSKVLTPTDLTRYNKKKRGRKPKNDTSKEAKTTVIEKIPKRSKSPQKQVVPGKSAEFVESDNDSATSEPHSKPSISHNNSNSELSKSPSKTSQFEVVWKSPVQSSPGSPVSEPEVKPKEKDKKKSKSENDKTKESRKEKKKNKTDTGKKEKKSSSSKEKKSETSKENDGNGKRTAETKSSSSKEKKSRTGNESDGNGKRTEETKSSEKSGTPERELQLDSVKMKSEDAVSVKYVGSNVKLLETATIDTVKKRFKSGSSNHSDEVSITPIVKEKRPSKSSKSKVKAMDGKDKAKSESSKTVASPGRDSSISGDIVMASSDKDSVNSDLVKSTDIKDKLVDKNSKPSGHNKSSPPKTTESRKRKLSDNSTSAEPCMNIGKIMSEALQKSAEHNSLSEGLKKVREIEEKIADDEKPAGLDKTIEKGENTTQSDVSQESTLKDTVSGKTENIPLEENQKAESVRPVASPAKKLSSSLETGTDVVNETKSQAVEKPDQAGDTVPDESEMQNTDEAEPNNVAPMSDTVEEVEKLDSGDAEVVTSSKSASDKPPTTPNASPQVHVVDTKASEHESSVSTPVATKAKQDVSLGKSTLVDTDEKSTVVDTDEKSTVVGTDEPSSSVSGNFNDVTGDQNVTSPGRKSAAEPDKSKESDSRVINKTGDGVKRPTAPTKLSVAAQAVLSANSSNNKVHDKNKDAAQKDVSPKNSTPPEQTVMSDVLSNSSKDAVIPEEKTASVPNSPSTMPLVEVKDEPVSAKTSPAQSSKNNLTLSSAKPSTTTASDVRSNQKVSVTLLELLRSCGDCKVRLIDCIKFPNVKSKLRVSEYSKMSDEERRELERRERKRREKLERRQREATAAAAAELERVSSGKKEKERKRLLSDDEEGSVHGESSKQAPHSSSISQVNEMYDCDTVTTKF